MKRIVLTVTTDLVFDQRMKRICTSLSSNGYDVLLVGRKKRSSPKLNKEPFKQVRLRCFFEKGKLFYLEYNIRLFAYLLVQHFDAVCGIDLDTLFPAFLAAKIKRKALVYDAHEYFTEMEEVVSRKMVKRTWKLVEQIVVPKVDAAYTVSEGYANLFYKEYKIPFSIVRNVAVKREPIEKNIDPSIESMVLYQGAVNHGRGLFQVVQAMEKVNGKLVICGRGDIDDDLKALTKELKLEDKVSFEGYVQPEKLIEYTRKASVGLTLFESDGLSNKYSLANRFFDYFHSGVPQLAMSYPEYKKFNSEFEVAALIDDLEPFTIASTLNKILKDKAYSERLRLNALKARNEVNWQNEEKVLLKLYHQLFTKK